jgi:hypothetical protein
MIRVREVSQPSGPTKAQNLAWVIDIQAMGMSARSDKLKVQETRYLPSRIPRDSGAVIYVGRRSA